MNTKQAVALHFSSNVHFFSAMTLNS